MSGLIINPYAFATGGGGGTLITGLPGGYFTFSTSGQWGWEFTAESDITVTALRINVPFTGFTCDARLWQVSGSSLLGSVSIVGVNNEWAEGELASSVALSSGSNYALTLQRGGSMTMRYNAATNFTLNTDVVTYVQARYLLSGTTFPTSTEANNLYGVVDAVFG